MTKQEAKFVRSMDSIQVKDSTWIDLGQLRSLVNLADERNWPDSALVSNGIGTEHPSERHLRVTSTLVVEGTDPQQ